MQGLSLGPADLAASRRMKTTRVGGGHPGYLVREDPRPGRPDAPRATAQQDLWHYTIARMVDACAADGIFPYYGPFGDIKDIVACEDQFRNAYLLGCVGAWSLHPVQIDIAAGVLPGPRRGRVGPAGDRRDGRRHRRGHARRQDAGRRHVKQCRVMVELARDLAARDPELAEAYGAVSAELRPRRSVLYMPSSNARALEKARDLPADAIIFDLEDAVAPDAKDARPRAGLRRGGLRRVRPARARRSAATAWTPRGASDDLRAAGAAGPDAVVVPKVSGRRRTSSEVVAAAAARRTAGVGDGRDAGGGVQRPRDRRAPRRSPCS